MDIDTSSYRSASRETGGEQHVESPMRRQVLIGLGIGALVIIGRNKIQEWEWERSDPNIQIARHLAEDLEKKRYHYALDGFRFASDTIPEEEAKNAWRLAKQHIGGPYWRPKETCVVEALPIETIRVAGTTIDKIPAVLIAQEERQRLVHEFIHLLIGPKSDQWSSVFNEFLAHVDSVIWSVIHEPHAVDDPTVSMTDDALIYTDGPLKNFRLAILHEISSRLSDEKRRAICHAAIARRFIAFEDLEEFLAPFGIDHAIFKTGRLGKQQRAFLGTSVRHGGKVVSFLSYEASRQGGRVIENGLPFITEIALLNSDHKSLTTGTVEFTKNALQQGTNFIEVPPAISGIPVAYIEIPSWDQTLDVRTVE